MRFNLKDGRRSLCYSCKESQVLKNSQGKETIICHYNHGRIRIITNVVECDCYESMNEMDEFEAERRGWVLEIKNGRIIGFKPPNNND